MSGQPMYYAPMPESPERARRNPADLVSYAVLGLLGLASLILSGWSLTTMLLGVGTPLAVAVFAVGVFDLLALMACVQVYIRRNEPHTAGGARLVMLVSLMTSSVVNGAHGASLGGWTTAVILAAAPLAFEIAFELKHRTLTALIWVLWRKQAWNALRRDAWVRIAPQVSGPQVVEVERIAAGPVAGLRAETVSPQVAAPQQAAAPLPESAPVAEIEPQVRVPEPRISTAAAVRSLVKEGVTDPKAVMDALPRLTGRPVSNPATVRREIRNAKASTTTNDLGFGFGRSV